MTTACLDNEPDVTSEYFTPYQLILGTMTLVYALRHADDLLGIGRKCFEGVARPCSDEKVETDGQHV